MNSMLKMSRALLGLFLFLVLGSSGQQKRDAVTFYVAKNGQIGNSGSITSPFPALDAAVEAIDKIPGPIHATVYIRGGVYRFSESFLLLQSGSDTNRHISFYAYNHEKVTFSGGTKLNAKNFHLV